MKHCETPEPADAQFQSHFQQSYNGCTGIGPQWCCFVELFVQIQSFLHSDSNSSITFWHLFVQLSTETMNNVWP